MTHPSGYDLVHCHTNHAFVQLSAAGLYQFTIAGFYVNGQQASRRIQVGRCKSRTLLYLQEFRCQITETRIICDEKIELTPLRTAARPIRVVQSLPWERSDIR